MGEGGSRKADRYSVNANSWKLAASNQNIPRICREG